MAGGAGKVAGGKRKGPKAAGGKGQKGAPSRAKLAVRRRQLAQDFGEFLGGAVSSWHAAAAMAAQLQGRGFEALEPDGDWKLRPGGRHLLVRDGSLLAFRHLPGKPWRIVGAHTDSPHLRLKPRPWGSAAGVARLSVEVYGGALLHPWLDRDLAVAGRLVVEEGNRARALLVDSRRPLACIPSLAIHLHREANKGWEVNPQTHLQALLSGGEGGVPEGGEGGEGKEGEESGGAGEGAWQRLLRLLLAEAGCKAAPEDVLAAELALHSTEPAAQLGLDGEWLAGPRLDNLLSCYAGMAALQELEAKGRDGGHSWMLLCHDHEEVGSQSFVGADSPLLTDLLGRLDPDPAVRGRLLADSLMLSVDNAHAQHPNWPQKHDDNHGPRLNGGLVLKHNANQRYATDALGTAWLERLCRREGLRLQRMAMRADMACGSTIGPISAGRSGIRTLDIGAAQWAMHSPREVCGLDDLHDLRRLLGLFWQGG